VSHEHGLGGFVDLDPRVMGPDPFPSACATFATARAAMVNVLRHLAPRRVWVPHYVCNEVHHVVHGLGIERVTYPIGRDLRPMSWPAEADDEVVILVDYFGVVPFRAQGGPGTVLLDHSQALYAAVPKNTWAVSSARKFLGVPDGAWLYGPKPLATPSSRALAPTAHLEARARGLEAYPLFQDAEARQRAVALDMSLASRLILGHTDHAEVRAARRRNYQLLHQALGPSNHLVLPLPPQAVPLCYPYLPSASIPHAALHAEQVWVPRYWPGIEPAEDSWEHLLVAHLLPLPVDQRYDDADMRALLERVQRAQEATS